MAFPTRERDLLDCLLGFLKNGIVILNHRYSSIESEGSELSSHGGGYVWWWLLSCLFVLMRMSEHDLLGLNVGLLLFGEVKVNLAILWKTYRMLVRGISKYVWR